MNKKERDATHHQAITHEQMLKIMELANSIRYGSITLVLQDGILTQIDKSEKIRLHPQ
jgi:hypothetical protein